MVKPLSTSLQGRQHLYERDGAEGRKLTEFVKNRIEWNWSWSGRRRRVGNTRLASEGRTQEQTYIEATHVPFRDWCTNRMMGRGRTHHHVTKQRSEDETRRPTITMDHYFMRVMQIRGINRTIKCHIESNTQDPLGGESHILPCLVQHAGCVLSRCQKGRDGKTPLDRLHGKSPTRDFVPSGEKVLAKLISTDPVNRMNPRYNFGIWFAIRNSSAECYEQADNNVIGVP